MIDSRPIKDDLFDHIDAMSPEPMQDEIDDAILKYPQFSPYYVWSGIRTDIRDEINHRWRSINNFSEKNFSKEFPELGKYHSKLWELNTRYLFRNKISRGPQAGDPDLISEDFTIECVVPAPNDVPAVRYEGKLHDYPTEHISRRVTQALCEKLKQLEKRMENPNSSIDFSNTPYIIAISLSQAEYRSARHGNGLSIIEAILMGAGHLQVTFDADGSNGSWSIAPQHSIAAKSGDEEIPTAYFQRDEWKIVSAVLWTTEGLPDESDITILLNPEAIVPLDPLALGINSKIVSYHKVSDGYVRDQKLEDNRSWI